MNPEKGVTAVAMQDRKKKNPVHWKLKCLESIAWECITVHLQVEGWEQLECSVTL